MENKKRELLIGEIVVRCVHPNPCWVIRNSVGTASYANKGSLFVFSNQSLADSYIAKIGLADAVVKRFSWDNLVDCFSKKFKDVIIDPSPDHDGFCTICNLAKD